MLFCMGNICNRHLLVEHPPLNTSVVKFLHMLTLNAKRTGLQVRF